MELFHLRYFLVVAKYENFSKAASELFISQPSVSKAIGSLEAELGVELFIRNGKRIQLNEAGRALRDRLVPVIGAVDNLKHELQVVSGKTKSTLILNVLAASSLLPDMLVKFKNMYPLIDFQLTQKDKLAKCDLCICSTLPNIFLDNGLLVLSEEIMLAVPVNSPLGLKDSVELKDLREENFILLSNSLLLREITDHFFELCGYRPHIGFESDNPNTIRDLISAGLGISMWPEVTWGKIASDKAKLLHISNPICRRNIFVTWDKEELLSEHSRLFRTFIKDYFKGLLQNAFKVNQE